MKEMEGTAHVDYLDHLCLRKDFDIILTWAFQLRRRAYLNLVSNYDWLFCKAESLDFV